jgi:hypothetical protein
LPLSSTIPASWHSGKRTSASQAASRRSVRGGPNEAKGQGLTSLRLVPSNASADHPAAMSNGGSCHAAASDQGPTWTASETNLRRHSIRLKWRERHGLRRRCEGQRKCNSGQPDHSSLPCVNSSRRDSLEAAHTIRTNAQIRARVSLEMKIHPKFVLHASRAPLPASPKPSTLPSSAETAPSPPRRPT